VHSRFEPNIDLKTIYPYHIKIGSHLVLTSSNFSAVNFIDFFVILKIDS